MKTLMHYLLYRVGFAKPETQTSIRERDCLARHAVGKRCLVEIGVWHGVTTCRLREAMAPDGMLFAVDPYPVGRLGISFPRLIAHDQLDRLTKVKSSGYRCPARTPQRDFARVKGILIFSLSTAITVMKLREIGMAGVRLSHRAEWWLFTTAPPPWRGQLMMLAASGFTRANPFGSALGLLEIVDTLTVLSRSPLMRADSKNEAAGDLASMNAAKDMNSLE